VIREAVSARFESSGRAVLVVAMGGGTKVMRRDKTTVKYVKTASSAAVKKADRKAWAAAQALTGFVSVSAPEGWSGGELAVPKLAPVPPAYMDLAGVLRLREHPCWAVLKELADAEAAAKDELAKVAAGIGWDGIKETFADGWSLALARMEFNEAKLKAADPALWDQVARVVERRYGGQLRVVDYDTAVAQGWLDDDIEVDEIDGD
jgi:hypothetical protein